MALQGTAPVVVGTPASGVGYVTLVCPSGGQIDPFAPMILSAGQATTTAADGTKSAVIVFGVTQSPVTGEYPVQNLKLYRGLTPTGPFSYVADLEAISTVVIVNSLFDRYPNFGTTSYYVATAIDTHGNESPISNVVPYTPSAVVLGLVASTISSAALGPYPVLGSDVYLDPTTREAVIGPNGDLLTVNGLECLAQDLRIRILTEYGELPMHQDFGFAKGKIIGSGQANRQAQAQILVADIKDMLRKEPRVYKTLEVQITQSDAYSWIVTYVIMAISVEDPVRANLVVPYYTQAAA